MARDKVHRTTFMILCAKIGKRNSCILCISIVLYMDVVQGNLVVDNKTYAIRYIMHFVRIERTFEVNDLNKQFQFD